MENFTINSLQGDLLYSCKCETFKECVEQAVKNGINLSYTNFQGVDLSGADFTSAILIGANFTNARLVDANFTNARLVDANLTDVKAIETIFIGAILRCANLRFADFSYSDFRSADLSNADFTHANLLSVNLIGAKLTKTNFIDANLDFSCLPLWCGSLQMKTDEKQRRQIMFHLSSLIRECDNATDEENDIFNYVKDYANKFHRVDYDVKKL